SEKETQKKVNDIRNSFEQNKQLSQEEHEKKMAEIDAEHDRRQAEWQEKRERDEKERQMAYRNEAKAFLEKSKGDEEKRLAAFGYRKGETNEEKIRNIKKMAEQIPENEFVEGLATIRYFLRGFVNRKGEIIVPLKYNDTGDFSEGMAKVGMALKDELYSYNFHGFSGRYGFVDKTGKEVIPLIYDDATNFSDGKAKVFINQKYGLIDKTGAFVTSFRYDDIL